MKLQNIKTRAEFYEFADIWYQRAHRLMEVWQNTEETDEKRLKAFKLWKVMYNRVMKLVPMAIEVNQPKNKPKFESGGVCAV